VITCGYINNKTTSIQFDETAPDFSRASIVLTTMYWPVDFGPQLGVRDSFAAGVPYRVPANTCLVLPKSEAAALVAAGAAHW